MTTSEIATREESSINILPPSQPMSSNALAVLREHSQAMDIAFKYAQAVCGTRVCPARFYQKPEDGAAAILYGLEIGLSPSAALQKVVVIHGMPSLEARTMVALLKPRGYKVWTVSQCDESVTVAGRDLDGDVHESTWTIERAIKAGYVPQVDERTKKLKVNANGKLIGNEKYLTDPQAMLKAKAQAEVCRDMAPDVLLGITYSTEDLESERWEYQPVMQEPTAPAPVTVEEILGEGEETAEAASETPAEESSEDASGEQPTQPQPESDIPAENKPENIPAEDNSQVEASQPEPAPPKKAAAKKVASEKPKMRLALERRMFGLLKEADIEQDNKPDRLLIYAAILTEHTDPITSTNDLSDVEVAAIGDRLFAWSEKNEIGAKVTDILNRATLAEANAEATQQEGEK